MLHQCRGWNFENSSSITLDGQWEFFPNAFISHEDLPSLTDESRYVEVPGDWSSGFASEKDTSFGYGTYRLRILVDQPLHQPYAFLFPEIQAASMVEVNGKTEPAFGTLDENKESYTPKVTSYLSSYVDENVQEIELLIRTANFDHPYKGGIIRPVRFGSQAAIDIERMYSVGFQLVTFVILMLHGLYALILYLFQRQQKPFLVFFLLLFLAGVSVISDHDHILLIWFPINYAWDIKIRLLSYLWLYFFILVLAKIFSESKIGSKAFYTYTGLLSLYSMFLLLAQAELIYISVAHHIFTLLSLIPLMWAIFLVIKMVVNKRQDAVFLLLSATSIGSSVVWGILSYNQMIGPTHIYYPIDVIVAIIGFSAYWFKRYFRNAEENARLTKQLRETDKLKDQFLAHTSHELRTPLHGIMNIAQSVLDKEKQNMDEKSLKDMGLLLTISRRMSLLLNDLLDVLQLQDKRIVLNREPLRLQPIASGVISMLEFMTDRKPVELKMEIDDSLPPVLADEKRLIQILFNLLHNAIKYTPKGTILLSAQVKKKQVIIRVSDSGVGMDEQTQERIFLPYEQGFPGVIDGGGIGLGLSIYKQLVELHGSELNVMSEPNKGSIFSFTLPVALNTDPTCLESKSPKGDHLDEEMLKRMVREADSSLEWPSLPYVTPPFAENKLNILAVDDDNVNLKVLTSVIAEKQVNIISVTSGQEALELLGTREWDLLIIDVMMPHMSGYELTQKVREHFSLSELPILLLTARSQPVDIYTGFLSGANDYVTKPVDAMELKYRI